MILRFSLLGVVSVPLVWLAAAWVGVIGWPQFAFAAIATVEFNSGVVVFALFIFGVLLAWLVRLWMQRSPRLQGFWSDRAWSILSLGLCAAGFCASLAAGFWIIDAETFRALGQAIGMGENPYLWSKAMTNDPTEAGPTEAGMPPSPLSVGPLPQYIFAAIYHWLPLSNNWANALWTAVVGVSGLAAALIAFASVLRRKIDTTRALLFAASPLFLIWAVATLNPMVLAMPMALLGFLWAARGAGTAAGTALAVATAINPLFALCALPALLPGPTVYSDKPMRKGPSLRGFILFVVLSAIFYAPLGVALFHSPNLLANDQIANDSTNPGLIWALASFGAKVQVPLLSTQLSNVHGWLDAPLVRLALVALLSLCVSVGVMMAHSAWATQNSNGPKVRRDFRARAAIYSLFGAIVLMPSVPATIALVMVPFLARVPNLAVALAITSLVFYSLPPTTMLESGWLSLLVPSLPIILGIVGAFMEGSLGKNPDAPPSASEAIAEP